MRAQALERAQAVDISTGAVFSLTSRGGVSGAANLGWHSLLGLSLGHTVIAFEPMESNIKLLKHSLCLNPGLADNFELHEVCVCVCVLCLCVSCLCVCVCSVHTYTRRRVG